MTWWKSVCREKQYKEIDFVVQKPNNDYFYYQLSFTINYEKTFE